MSDIYSFWSVKLSDQTKTHNYDGTNQAFCQSVGPDEGYFVHA